MPPFIVSRARARLPWALLAGLLSPLVYYSGLLFPAVAGKTLWLETVILIALALFALVALSGEPLYWGRLRRWPLWLPAALLALEYLTSLVGFDFASSFWGEVARGDGLLSMTLLTAYFYIFILAVDAALWRKALTAIALVGSLSALIGLVQWVAYISHTTIPLLQTGADRVGGLFGNAEFLAGYLALSGFFTLILALRAKGPRAWQALAALQFAVAVLTATRGTILALLAAGVIVLIALALRAGPRQRLARSSLLAIVLIALLGVALRAPLSHAPFEPLRRVASISLADPTVANRLFVWQGILVGSLHRPLLGAGAAHVAQLFDRAYNPTQVTEEWFDRAHNAYLDYFAEFGVLGFALYLALIVLLVGGSSRAWRASGEPIHLLLALAGVVYAVQNSFAFDTPESLLLFLLLYASYGVRPEDVESRPALPPAAGYAGILLALCALYLIVPVVYRPWAANRAFVEAYLYQVSDLNRYNAALTRALEGRTYLNREIGYQLEDMYVNNQLPRLSGGALAAAYAIDANALLGDYQAYPWDARSALDLAEVLDQVPAGTPPNLVLQVEAAARARQLSPLRSEAWYLLVNADIAAASLPANANDAKEYYDDAIGALKEYLAQAPTLSRPKLILAELYLTVGEPAKADALVEALRREDPALLASNPDFARAVAAYEASQR